MRRLCLVALTLGFGSGCPKDKTPAKTPPAHRMQILPVTGNTVTLIPSEGQMPYCLVYTRTKTGITRQITMVKSLTSTPCFAGKPVLGLTYRIPVNEGPVKVFSFFSDQKLTAPSVAAQIVEIDSDTGVNPMNLRLPGQVVVDMQEYTPKEEEMPVIGEVVDVEGSSGKDAGAASAVDAGK